ncbi:hypothetical protein [Actinomadura rugatobispora]|uniref:GPP34 family phosphoprotein n=1 Tax=Actinomadura rugatobispora TaxID=1994 RepID=A0ABW1AAJ3_9ACTN|nr:hypothetical protein GCM10010200_070060 [Actinomadura rugatobispora]
MMTLDDFSPSAGDTLIRAAMSAEGPILGTGPLLRALAQGGPVAGVELSPDALPKDSGRALLATLGIDLDDVHHRAYEATSLRLDDPSLWRLRRSPLLPLRVTLTGPGTRATFNEAGRKTLEVALWSARRRGLPSATREDLLWGLLADASNDAVRILRRQRIDLHRLWTTLKAA